MSQWHELLTNAVGYKLHCFKFYNETNRAEIFSLKREKVKVAENNRTEFTIDTGTLKIINVTWNDTGLYVVERYDKNGKREADIKFNLQVQGKFTFLKSYFSASCCNFWSMFSFPIIF
uniref:Immunoglobulin V-set domain-containing protein n=1 Tax=Xiphophorus couchianus TaxID=32473 RepID=A0A3B5KVE8_9TELE